MKRCERSPWTDGPGLRGVLLCRGNRECFAHCCIAHVGLYQLPPRRNIQLNQANPYNFNIHCFRIKKKHVTANRNGSSDELKNLHYYVVPELKSKFTITEDCN